MPFEPCSLDPPIAVLVVAWASLGCGAHPATRGPGDTRPEAVAARYGSTLDSSPWLPVAPVEVTAPDREAVDPRYRVPFDSSPTLAVAPSGRIAMAWVHIENVDSIHPAIQYALSSDGGATWTAPSLRDDDVGFDPALAVDHRGTFYLASISGPPGRRNVVVATAPVGSSRFGPAVRIRKSEGADGPSLAVTPSGTVLLTWAVSGSAEATCGRSTDGEHWTLARLLPEARSPDRIRWGYHVCAPARGDRTWVVYADASRHHGEDYIGEGFGLQYSDDDGGTWSSRETSISLSAETGLGGRVSPSCAGDGKNVWVLYGLSHDPAPPAMIPRSTALRLARSTDGGESFAAHDTVSGAAAGDLYLTPALARGLDGSLHVVYYGNGAEGAGEDRGGLVWSSSHDLGTTFGPPLPLRTALRFVHLWEDHWLGYWIGVVVAEGALHVAYVDNAGHPSRIAYLRRPLP